MAVPIKLYEFVDGQTAAGLITAERLNGDFDPLYTCLDPALGGLEDSNVKAGAKILCSDRSYTGAAKITGTFEFDVFPTIPAASVPDAKLSSNVMLKTTYDAGLSGVVDNAEHLGGELPAYYAPATHSHVGGDGVAIVEGALSLTDVATGNVSTAAHGFAPKAPDDTTKFLRGDATWASMPATVQTVIGAVVDIDNLAAKQTVSTEYVKLKEIKINEAFSGKITVAWEHGISDDAHTAYSRIYLNGVAYGAEKSTQSEIPVAVSTQMDEDFEVDDLIQIYAKTSNVAAEVDVSAMTIEYSWGITDIFGHELASPLITTAVTEIDTTNQDPV